MKNLLPFLLLFVVSSSFAQNPVEVITIRSGVKFEVPEGHYALIDDVMIDPFYQPRSDKSEGQLLPINACGKNIAMMYNYKIVVINGAPTYFFESNETYSYSELPFKVGTGTTLCIPSDHQSRGATVSVYRIAGN